MGTTTISDFMETAISSALNNYMISSVPFFKKNKKLTYILKP